MTAVQLIPLATGGLIFVSILIANQNDPRKRRTAWILGLVSQLLLITFGVLTGNYAFASHVLVALAFGYNLIRGRRNREIERTDHAPGGDETPQR